MAEQFAALFEESSQGLNLKRETLITGVVSGIENDMVLVHVGLKSEACIPMREFKDTGGELNLDVGDNVEVALWSMDNGFGQTIVSRELARRLRAWDEMEKAYEESTSVEGILCGRIKGGFIVEIEAVRAFLPGSLIDVRPLYDATHLESTPLQFKIIKFDRERGNVVVSRRAVILESMHNDRDGLLSQLKEGEVRKGVVKNLTTYGAFVDLGGIDGLLHSSDISWKRIGHPSEVLEPGQEIDVKILGFDRAKMRISLGRKQLEDNPWERVGDLFPPGTVHTGTVTSVREYGCFVELGDGIEGLVHCSQMDWLDPKPVPSRIVSDGDEVKVKVLELDYERHRVSLGMKQCRDNPWEVFTANHRPGDKLKGVIRSITDFGIFVGLEYGMDGLVHISDVTWDAEEQEKAVEEYKKGQAVEVVLLQSDMARERISLGIKQLTADPFENFVKDNKRGSRVTGKVEEIFGDKVLIRLNDDMVGELRAREASVDQSVDDINHIFSVGQEVEAAIKNLDYRYRRVELSIAALERSESRETMREHRRQAESSRTGMTLGDMADSSLTLEKSSDADAEDSDAGSARTGVTLGDMADSSLTLKKSSDASADAKDSEEVLSESKEEGES